MRFRVGLLALWMAGMALPGLAVDKEVIQLQQSVALLQGMVREMQRDFDEKMAVMQTQVQQSADQAKQLQGQLGDLDKAVQNSVGNAGQRVDNLNGQIQGVQSSLDDLRARLDKLSDQMTKLQSASQTIPGGGAPAPGSGQAAPASPDLLYNTALRDFTSGNYPLAMQEFSDYLKFYTDSPLASDAQYYIGDIYYQQGQFQEAIEQYDKAIEQYPDGNKTAAAQLKKGFAYLNLNLRPQGEKELNSLIKRFPNTPEASLAQDKLASLPPEKSTGRKTVR